VFDEPSLTRDVASGERLPEHTREHMLDANIVMSYVPGTRPRLAIVGGPGLDDLRLIRPGPGGTPEVAPLIIDEPVAIAPAVTLAVRQFAAHSQLVTRPSIVPRAQRDREIDAIGVARMVRAQVPGAGGTEETWLPFHLFAFERPEDVLMRFRYEPTTLELPDGRVIEMMYSRARHRLPAPVVLDDFRISTHIGGYAGTNTSVRDWTSVVRFADGDGWAEPEEVSLNAPREHDGFWFYQAQWDPPLAAQEGRPGSAGLNYTVLGVGNRQGVLVQLAGCCLAVLGMIYAFYIKPMIRRRRQGRVNDTLEVAS